MNDDLCPWPMMVQGKSVRSMIDERDKSFWAHAGDVGELLGYVNIREALSRIKPEWKKGVSNTDTPGGPQTVTYISEQAVYKLVFTSRKPEAEALTDRVADIMTKIRSGELTLRPRAQGITEHIDETQQKHNSTSFNRQLYIEGGVDAIIRQNAKILKFISDKHLYPKQYKEWGKELGYPAKDRSSGQQVLRRLEPWSACACSLVKNLMQMGMPEEEALIESEKQKAFFARLLRYATPHELDQEQEHTP